MSIKTKGPDGGFFQFLHGDRETILETEEVAALLKFASEQGCEDPELVGTLFKQLRAYENAVATKDLQQQEAAAHEMLYSYTTLTKLMNGVNGRTLLAGRNLFWETKIFMLLAFGTFVVCILTLALGDWVQNEPIDYDFWLPPVAVHLVKFFTPFFWGALGAFVYILKRITDFAAEYQFDPDKFQGWLTRLSLGAILGWTITYIIDPAAFGEVTLNSTAIAFLSGLGTKVIYGGLQRLIQILADKMNLDMLHERPSRADTITKFIAGELTKTDPDQNPEKYQVLTELLETRRQTKPGANDGG